MIVKFSQPVSLLYYCQTRNRDAKSKFHELDRSLNNNIFDKDGNARLNLRSGFDWMKEATIEQEQRMSPSATTTTAGFNVRYVDRCSFVV